MFPPLLVDTLSAKAGRVARSGADEFPGATDFPRPGGGKCPVFEYPTIGGDVRKIVEGDVQNSWMFN